MVKKFNKNPISESKPYYLQNSITTFLEYFQNLRFHEKAEKWFVFGNTIHHDVFAYSSFYVKINSVFNLKSSVFQKHV